MNTPFSDTSQPSRTFASFSHPHRTHPHTPFIVRHLTIASRRPLLSASDMLLYYGLQTKSNLHVSVPSAQSSIQSIRISSPTDSAFLAYGMLLYIYIDIEAYVPPTRRFNSHRCVFQGLPTSPFGKIVTCAELPINYKLGLVSYAAPFETGTRGWHTHTTRHLPDACSHLINT